MTSAWWRGARGCARCDRGDVVVGSLIRLVAVVLVFGIAIVDGASIVVARLGAADNASTAATAASDEWQRTHNINAAYAAARAAAGNDEVLTQGFTAAADGTVHVLVRRKARSLVMSHIGPLRKYTVVTEAGEARSTS
jgi:hypothetical protein